LVTLGPVHPLTGDNGISVEFRSIIDRSTQPIKVAGD
jgi:hypothetical protein